MGDYLKYPKDRKKYPTEEIDSQHFISDDEVKEMVSKLDRIEFDGNEYNIPHPVEDYLEIVYGKNWKTPKPDGGYLLYLDRIKKRGIT